VAAAVGIHEPMILQRTKRPSTVRVGEQLDSRFAAIADRPLPQSATLDLYLLVRTLLPMVHPADGRRLS